MSAVLSSFEPSIQDAAVSLHGLKALLDRAFIDAEFDDDGDLYVREGVAFPIWVRLDPEYRLIVFQTYITSENSDHDGGATVANELNKTLILAQFHAHGPTLAANAWLSYAGGLSAKAFIRTLQRFSSVFARALLEPCAAEWLEAHPAHKLN